VKIFESLPAMEDKEGREGKGKGCEAETEEERIERLCPYCYHGDEVMFKEEQLHHKGICLHAWKYEGRSWKFETQPPTWAQGLLPEL